MSQNHQSIFNLPRDVIFDILSRLPTKSLIQFRSVSASSPALISDQAFTNLHLSSTASAADHHLLIYYESTDYLNHFYSLRSPITFNETLKIQIPYKHVHGYLRIVGSSKGLICFFDTNYYSHVGRVILWNPSIQKIKKIENPNNYVHDRISHLVVGFGFVSRTIEFKVVGIAYYLDNSRANCVLVYSLSTDSWDIKIDSVAPCVIGRGWSNSVFVNGFVNWLAYKSQLKLTYDAIMAFDLDNESFSVLQLPKNVGPDYDQVSLASSVSGESLCLGVHYPERHGERWDMWVMGDYGMADSWKKVCVVLQPTLSVPPLLIRGDCDVIIVMNDGRLMLCDASKGEFQDLDTCGLPRSFHVISYTSTLALLDG